MASDSLEQEVSISLDRLVRQLAKMEARMVAAAKKSEKTWAASNARVTKQFEQASAASRGFFKISGAQRFAIQNASNQFGDMAVQIAGGTSAMRAMSQQVPQLLGGFGALGGSLGLIAPLLGTVAAIGLPLVAIFATMGNEADEAAEKVEAFADRLNAAHSALNDVDNALANMNIDKAVEQYGRLTSEVEDMLAALLEADLAVAQIAGREVVSELLPGIAAEADDIRNYADEIERINALLAVPITRQGATPRTERSALVEQRDDLVEVREQVEAISQEMEILPEQAAEFLARLSDSQAALDSGDYEAAANALQSAWEYAVDLGVSLENGLLRNTVSAEEVLRQVAQRLREAAKEGVKASEAAQQTAQGVSVAADEADRLTLALQSASGTLSGLIDQAGSLWTNLSGAAQAAFQIGSDAAERVIYNNRVGRGRGGNPFEFGEGAEARRNTIAGQLAPPPSATPLRSGGSSGGGSSRSGGGSATADPLAGFLTSAADEVRALEQQIEMIGKTEAQVAGLTAKYQALDEVRRQGIDLDRVVEATNRTVAEEINAHAAEVERLSERYTRGEEAIDTFTSRMDQLGESIARVIVFGDDLGETLGNMFRQVASDFITSGFSQIGQSMAGWAYGGGGGGGSFLQKLIGGVFGGGGGSLGVPTYAGGGYTGAGSRSGGIDGLGGFPAILHPNETVIDHTRAGSGGTNHVVVDVFVNDDGNLDARARQAGREGGQEVAVRVRQEVPQIMDEHTKRYR